MIRYQPKLVRYVPARGLHGRGPKPRTGGWRLWDAVRRKEARLAAEERRRQELEARRRWEENQRRRQEELRRRRHIDRLANRWQRSQKFLAFIAATEAAIALTVNESAPELVNFLEWARTYARNLDPLAAEDLVKSLLTEPQGSEDED